MARRVLLLSGGLDSISLYYIYDFDVVLFFNTGTEDNKKELKVVENAVEDFEGVFEIIDLPIKRFELENKIIPFRNNLFILIAAQFGNEIHIGNTLGDTTKDKDYVFSSQMESVLNYFALDSHKMPHSEYPFKVVMPWKDITKTWIVRELIESYGKKQATTILTENSRSCYSSEDGDGCMQCRSCLRKMVALINNDIYPDYYPSRDVLKSILIDHQNESIEKGRHEREIQEINHCIEKLR